MKIVSSELWQAVQARWAEIEKVFLAGRKQRGFSQDQKSRVQINPHHLFSGNLKCGACGGAIGLVSGKGSGYYGCINATRKACDNTVLVSRAKLEKHMLGVLFEKVLKPELLGLVYDKVAKAVREESSHLPEEIRIKRLELNSAESRLHNFIEFIAQGRAPKSVTSALEEAEQKVSSLKILLQSLESAKDDLFEAPPQEWVAVRLTELQTLLERRTEQSALLLRRYLGPRI